MANMFKETPAKTPAEYIALVDDERRADIKALDKLVRSTLPKEKPHIMSGMLGYGKFHYKSKSGREGDWMLIALAAQKNYISLYVCASDGKKYLPEYYKKELPKASIGRSCIRFKKLADVDQNVLKEILKKALKLKPAM